MAPLRRRRLGVVQRLPAQGVRRIDVADGEGGNTEHTKLLMRVVGVPSEELLDRERVGRCNEQAAIDAVHRLVHHARQLLTNREVAALLPIRSEERRRECGHGLRGRGSEDAHREQRTWACSELVLLQRSALRGRATREVRRDHALLRGRHGVARAPAGALWRASLGVEAAQQDGAPCELHTPCLHESGQPARRQVRIRAHDVEEEVDLRAADRRVQTVRARA